MRKRRNPISLFCVVPPTGHPADECEKLRLRSGKLRQTCRPVIKLHLATFNRLLIG
jgi:hypothetical protein